jgi:hypothetical protein
MASFARLHERGLTPRPAVSCGGLCYHYGVELHNFDPNAISQVATFVAICEGFLGVPASGTCGFTCSRVNSSPCPPGQWARAG